MNTHSSPTPASQLPVRSVLAQELEMGVVELNVLDLKLMSEFYQEIVGLEVLERDAKVVTLGFQEREIVRLVHTPDLKQPPIASAGLYHLAIVFASRSTLAQALTRVLEERLPLGTADHLVSEAFYFADPEGNGIELYFDKDPSGWQWRNGLVQMDSLYIDPREYIRQYAQASGAPTKEMGHVHLKVGDIAQAAEFYGKTIGFAPTAKMPTALFWSNGTYHHHLGMNVWESAGTGKRAPSLGLSKFEIFMPELLDLELLEDRLQEAKYEHTRQGETLELSDPWGNTIVFRVGNSIFGR